MMTKILALTGSIATGKSTVLEMFRDEDVAVFSADEAVHAAYADEAVAPVEALLGAVSKKGEIDRRQLAKKLLENPEKLKQLEKIVHPLVFARANRFVASHRQQHTPLVVLEIPLLFETENRYRPDWTAVTWCDDETQRARALARPGMTVEKLATILARQMPQEDKKKRADFLIDTGTTPDQTRAQVRRILDQIQSTSQAS